MDIQTLQDARPDALFAAADAYTRLSAAFADHRSTWANGVEGRVDGSGWTGSAADSAGTSLRATTTKLDAASQELHMIAPILREGAEAFLLAQNKLDTLLKDAAAEGYRVGQDGSVSWGASDPSGRSDPGQGTTIDQMVRDQFRETAAAAYSARIAQALDEAEQADRSVSDRLRTFTDNARTGTGLSPGQVVLDRMAGIYSEDLVEKSIPAKGTSPDAVNAWWQGLPPEEQQRLVRNHPHEIGNLDGIPSPARDQANRINLDRTIAGLESRTDLSPDEQEQLDGFRKIKERLADEDRLHHDAPEQNPRPYLLAVDTVGQGRAAISFGNPDTATDVVSYVPGLGTKIGGIGGGDGDRAKDLWSASHTADPSKDVASITWIGYDAPQLKGVATESLTVAGTERAAQGGEAYQGFLQGLRATHEGEPAHMTALGHSYGSFTVGQAAQRPGGIPVDDIILVGSPGTGAQRADQLGIDPQHVWVGAAENDPVTHLPSENETTGMGAGAVAGIGGGPAGMVVGAGLGWVGGHYTDEHELWFGQDPASKEFGGNRFAVDPGPAMSFDSHSDYWNYRGEGDTRTPTVSLNNMAEIVTGHGDQTVRQDYR
ncbi:hypothetical protein HUT16_19840 [Kitasatospora sp. NA04385]|uniref:alpha/beta hydrolase n=1 Tax=Kitasatospora sp. NA04385 TaxID=2742135 RepID=UPI0015908955|nr:alpha/beta hydrolase [Kitasatospora sp. NA04385]QKW21006.1 hypothetical protein HUT16_19840 [Kitasatospora sp. NA04385]